MEQWIQIKDYPDYHVSSCGNIRRHSQVKGRVNLPKLKPYLHPNGYCYIRLYKDKASRSFRVHRVVAAHFIENSNGLDGVNHIDGNKHNNAVNNLEWVTHRQNIAHCILNGKHPTPLSKVMDADRIIVAENLRAKGMTQKSIGETLGVGQSVISRVLNKKRNYSK